MHFDWCVLTFKHTPSFQVHLQSLNTEHYPEKEGKKKIKTPPPKMTHQIDLFGFGRRCAAGGGDGGRTQRSVLLQQATLV